MALAIKSEVTSYNFGFVRDWSSRLPYPGAFGNLLKAALYPISRDMVNPMHTLGFSRQSKGPYIVREHVACMKAALSFNRVCYYGR
ncbi:hypothetical protein M0657_002985 [Pyricularia oryzae]|uniref:Uncharacterized protein n=3 Tax=Pyricularia oryzae TaxID=318829 RepID=A0A4P7NFI9_PYROR|nr:hypothetical protein OOU_Y34scaffold00448g44 [Pyricularia oryzae Y34]KAI7927354.1 hypothetical protein M9X92_002335 [Pyricularia oryzae]KAI7927866.1 hypothetical protein M0657_002985 [Pyricularia oryzae]QBZ60656.1 hypothetical protein PoMZ_07598 [Pyricularia oryzae]